MAHRGAVQSGRQRCWYASAILPIEYGDCPFLSKRRCIVDQVAGYQLWIGSVADGRNAEALHNAGILAVIDLAASESPATLPRDLVYCRMPLVDGAGNPPWLLQEAVRLLTNLLTADVPTLVHCGAGLSRSPTIAAMAVSNLTGVTPEAAMQLVADSHRVDPSPAFWNEVRAALDAIDRP